MKRKKNIIDDMSLLMLETTTLKDNNQKNSNDSHLINYINNTDNIDLKGRDGRTLLIHACTYNRISIVQLLIDKKSNINIQDDGGYTALHASVISNNINCAKLLVQAGADVNMRDNIGNVPLFYTAKNAFDMFHLLLSYGSKYATPNVYGISPIDIFRAYPTIIQIFDKYKQENQ